MGGLTIAKRKSERQELATRSAREPGGSKNAQRGKYGRLSAPVILFWR